MDNDVDNSFSWRPTIGGGNQSYHFNRPWGANPDSRLKLFKDYFEKAKKECSDKPKVKDDPTEAAKQLGIALHPKQDYYAHGDYGKFASDSWDIGKNGGVFTPHNEYSSQKIPGKGHPRNYPDDPELDAIGSADGRPAGSAMKEIRVWYLGWAKYEYADFKPGHRRIDATEVATVFALKDFRDYLKQQSKCCKCLDYFGVKGGKK